MSEIYKPLQDALKSRASNGATGERTETALRIAHLGASPHVAVSPISEPPAGLAGAERRPGHERRKRARAKVTMPAGVRVADAISHPLSEVVSTENASRAGLSFRTKARHYQEGMRLRIRFPYSAPHDGVMGTEDCAEIVRIETMEDGSFRVAVVFRAASFTARSSYAAGRSPTPTVERRRHKRTELSAIASVREEKADISLSGRCSELSLGGCYIDTLNPFSIGTRVSVKIEKNQKTFAWFARICSSHRGSGMGLSFEELPPAEMAALATWLEA